MRRLTGICIGLLLGVWGVYPEIQANEVSMQVSYSLQEVSHLAFDNNFGVQLARYDALIKQTEENVAKSIYDPIFEAEVSYRDNQRKQSTTILGSQVLDHDYNVGVSQKTSTGTTVTVDMTNNRHWTDSVFVTSPLTHDSTMGLTVSQDLGRNFFGLQDRGDIQMTVLDIENVQYTSMEKILGQVAESQKGYWDLVLARTEVDIENDMVAQAKVFYELHQEKLQDGLVEKPEAIAAEANYRHRENELLLAQNNMQAKNNALKLLLNIDNEAVVIVPKEALPMQEITGQLSDLLREAFDHRHDYKRRLNELKGQDIDITLKKNALWPQMNLTASLERNGLGNHFKQAVTNISDEDNPNFFAGVTFEFPLLNREAKAKLKASELEKAQALVQLKQLERQIAVNMADQWRDCQLFAVVAKNSESIAALQADKLKEEEKRFQQGRSDTDTLIRFQNDLVLARASAAKAKHRYAVALVDLEFKKGSLVEELANNLFTSNTAKDAH